MAKKHPSSFQSLREMGQPTYYNENKSPVTVDIVVVGIIVGFAAIAFAFCIILIGVRRRQERICSFVRITTSLAIGAVILVCNLQCSWEYGNVRAVLEYKAFTPIPVEAEVGLKIGLRGINVTLVGIPRQQHNMTIDYNERFSWEWAQGKPGFGYRAGRLNREYRDAQKKGLPYPILWIIEPFTIDEGNFRYGRYYRQAGWYCHIALWIALPLWLLSNILFFMVIRYGAYYLALTGGVLLLTNVLFANVRNSIPLKISLETQPLILHYGWCFYLVLMTGILCVILAILILFMDLRYPEQIAGFFNVDILHDYEDFYADSAELDLLSRAARARSPSHPLQLQTDSDRTHDVYTMRKRTMAPRFQRTSRKYPVPASLQCITNHQEEVSESPVYENINLTRFDPITEEEEGKNDPTALC